VIKDRVSLSLFKIIFLSAILIFSGMTSANEMMFRIGKDVGGFNVPFVSVTVCVPGTSNCQVIDRIKLDTGSTGLRIFKSALQNLNLPVTHDSTGNEIALCAHMAGGTGYWGPVVKADLALGDEKAVGANIHVVHPNYQSLKDGCASVPSDGRNGILGISTAMASSNGQNYFSCSALGCAASAISDNQKALNPIAYLSQNKNGFIISTPAVPETGTKNLEGVIKFGIGTQTNNQLQSKLTACRSRSDDFLQLKYNGVTYWTKFDSGTNAFNLPSGAVQSPFCQNSKVYLCPSQPLNYAAEILSADGSSCANLNLTISGDFFGPSSVTQSWVVPGLTESWGGKTSNQFILGMPFFFGKDIYYILDGQKSAIGLGPIVAF
jgi:hypothetical protein